MKVSGFTIVRNAIKYGYPIVEAISSVLPICDEFIINVGESEDNTLELVQSMKSPKIRIIRNEWDFNLGKGIVLDKQTDLALAECKGDWVFYIQADEVIHEDDIYSLRKYMRRYLDDDNVDALRMQWLNFYGSYYRYRIDGGWVQKQDRILKNSGQLSACGGAYGFTRKDGKPLKRKQTYKLLYHYGWVQTPEVMRQRRVNAEKIGYVNLEEKERTQAYDYGDLNRFPAYFGSHPKYMQERIVAHKLSQEDLKRINKKYWWHPFKWFKLRYKTYRRVKEKLTNT